MSTVRVLCLFLTLPLFLMAPLSAQSQRDLDAVHQLLNQYTETEEAMDMTAQARLMREDRVWIGAGAGRRTDQAKNMRLQAAQFELTRTAIPGIRWFVDDTDLLVKFYGGGNVAVASFFRYTTYIIPADAPPDMAEALGNTQPGAITLVLEKSDGEWKIVHTHFSNLTPPSGG
jgi:ketosteroid isomerase-like protein